MAYSVRFDRIAQDISNEVKDAILEFLPSYDFPYVTAVNNKAALKQVFIEHFQKRHSIDWLKEQILKLSHSKVGYATVAFSETNRLHTKGLGTVLLAQGQTECTTVHSYSYNITMRSVCCDNLEGKILDIKEVIANSFPKNRDDLKREDIPMIPQHYNCRHVMVPIE